MIPSLLLIWMAPSIVPRPFKPSMASLRTEIFSIKRSDIWRNPTEKVCRASALGNVSAGSVTAFGAAQPDNNKTAAAAKVCGRAILRLVWFPACFISLRLNRPIRWRPMLRVSLYNMSDRSANLQGRGGD